MPWKPLPSVAFAIATYPFRATEPNDLPLQIGDHIYVIEQGGKGDEWYRGYLVTPPSLLAGLTNSPGQQLEHRVFSGIFPRNCVEVRELLGENKVNGKAGEESEDSSGEATDAAATTAAATVPDDQKDGRIERRRSQRAASRRLSRALSSKRSHRDVTTRSRATLIDQAQATPRDPRAPKPTAPVPLLRVGDETGQSADEPLVDEIASCLREWHDARLHAVLLEHGYEQLQTVQHLIKKLDTSRKQLMHDVMTTKELNALREDTVWDLVKGNKLLNDEVIVRSPTERGRILTAEDSVIEMTKLQANMSILDRPPKTPADKSLLHHILVDVKTLVCESEVPATLQVCLCQKVGDAPLLPLTENYAIPVPLPTDLAAAPEDQPKTLFINLSTSDIGINAPTASLFLVFRLLKDEPSRQSSAAIANHANTGVSKSSSVSKPNLGTRRSYFGSMRKSGERGHSRGPSRSDRPTTSHSTRSGEETRSSTSNSEPPASRDVKMVKRIVGVGAIDIGSVAKEEGQFDRRVSLWTPATSPDLDRSDEGEDWQEIIRDLSRSPTGYSRLGSVKRFDVFCKAFASADLDGLIRVTPTLLHNVHLTNKLGFTGAPKERRSDIYLTLSEPIIPRNPNLAHAKFSYMPLSQRVNSSLANLQLTLEVRKADGERIEDCIFTASNHEGHTAWRTTGIESGEGWNQTIRLEVPPEDVPGSHIVMSIADSPNFPFALAWIPLWEADAFLRDGEHQALLYVYDEYSSAMVGGKGAYLSLPPWLKKSDPSSASCMNILIRTYLCSTQYSQDPTLLGLLEWRTLSSQRLSDLLERFSFVPEIEIVKLIEEVFEALFEILHEYAHSEVHEDLVFINFVYIFTITKDKRFDLSHVIETHATTRHKWPYVSQSLVKAYSRLLSNPLDTEVGRRLRATLKVGDLVLKLIVETKKEPALDGHSAFMNGEKHLTFKEDAQHIFVAIMALMRNPMPVLLGTQTLVVQRFHTWLPELTTFLDAEEVLETATDLLDACAHTQGQMILHRLILILNLSRLDVFKYGKVKAKIIARTFRWLDPYWGETNEVSDQWRAQVRLSCSIVATQMVELGEECCQYVPKLVESYRILQLAGRVPKKTFSMLFPTSLPFPAKRTSEEIEVEEAMLELSALMAAALATDKRLYFDANVVDIPGVLLQALKVGQSILNHEAFPQSWLSLLVSHHRFAITALERISEVLVESLPDAGFAPDAAAAFEFDTELWRAFFDTLFVAVSSGALTMETFPEQKRRAIWKIAGDVREQGAQLLKKTWEAIGWEQGEEEKTLYGFERMGGYQVQFVPDLIAPVVSLCLSVHASLRNVAIQVLRSMIISAWEIDQDLNVIQQAMIECLDKLCRTQPITESVLQKAFINELLDQFAPLRHSVEDSLYNAVVEMFHRIEELLGMLANVHQEVPNSSSGRPAANDAGKIMDTLRLLEFLKDVQSDEAYIRYVHQLADLQSSAGFHAEAGLALQLHAERYPWDSDTQAEAMTDPELPAQRTLERKEALYFQIIQHFERGYCWKRALDAYKELACQYESNLYDFSKLARTQRAMAAIYEKIAKGQMMPAKFFRVIYKGLGFPVGLRGKEFIYQGLPSDRLSAFEDRMQQLHPSAQILRVGQEPQDMEGQYMQVFGVGLHRDLEHKIYQRTKVGQSVRDYQLISTPQRFTSTTRNIREDVPLTEQEVEKTVYTTAESFPTILRRSEIVKTQAMVLSPLQAAVERTTRKTLELQVLERRINGGDTDAINTLSEQLLLAVDPSSSSSPARYRALLPASEVPDDASLEDDLELPPDEEIQLSPMQTALKVALLDYTIAIRRCLGLYTRSAHIATKAQLLPRFEATFEPELNILFPNGNAIEETPVEEASTWRERDSDGMLRSESRIDHQAQPPSAQIDATDAQQQSQQQQVLESRPGRRRSLNLFKRSSSLSLTGQNQGTGDNAANGGSHSRQDSRARGSSRTRRLSLFRSESKRDREKDIASGSGNNPYGSASRQNSVDDLGARSDATLKKRLSFLNSGKTENFESMGGAFV
ncbi:hypothetical protein K431DRAFT_282387 [Polychaeton citri CBS 116435]|uniref:Dedicator of cytokinesis protein 1 n=1 Tax=Polychaeton citri CBS 116435 TaxID=1314669 RepID=A0A9P4QCY1_9PEZI|nr:hypothetical protein K431DRAFT_282387 [Polychaeton citri CBS 116435]